jgi:hypothetical protein
LRFSAARPKKDADVAGSNVGVFVLPGGYIYTYATSSTPLCCRQGAHLLNGSTMVML